MSHLYGTIDLTVAGPQSEIQKVAGMLRGCGIYERA